MSVKTGGDRPSYGAVLERLASAQKPPAAGSPAYSRFVNRRIGRVLAALAFRVGLTPNQVTGLSAAFSAAAISVVALVPPTPLVAVLVVLGLLLGYALDSADGQLARLRGGGSPAGEWLDHVVDSVKVVVLHLAVLVAWYRFWDGVPPQLLLVPLAAAAVSSVFFFAQILTDQIRRAHPDRAPAAAGADVRAVLRSLVVIPTDYGLLCLAFALLAWPVGFAVAYAALMGGTALFLVAALPKWYREIATYTR